MKPGFQTSNNALKLLTDSLDHLNQSVAKCRQFATTQSGASIKYKIATVTFQTEKIAKELDKLIAGAKGV